VDKLLAFADGEADLFLTGRDLVEQSKFRRLSHRNDFGRPKADGETDHDRER
jgi:hypothetical protein